MTRSILFVAAVCLALDHPVAIAGDEEPVVTIDGLLDEWPAKESVVSDPDSLMVRFESHDPTQAIQAADFTTRIRIDADADSTTGNRLAIGAMPGDSALGAELVIELSPAWDAETIGGGVRVRAFSAGGDEEVISHADAGFFVLPTHNTESYELHISRRARGVDALRDPGPVRIAIEAVDPRGAVLDRVVHRAWLPMFGEDTLDEDLPARPEGALRVMVSNILFSSPLEHPQPFRRILEATDPDIVLYQEWFDTPHDKIRAWLDTHAPGDWSLIGGGVAGGLAIATRLPVLETWPVGGEGGWGRGGLAALIDHDGAQVLAVTVHLKCCGGADSSEERRRREQSRQINTLIRAILDEHPEASVVIGGDYNLVGTREPLENLARGLGARGDLRPAHTTRLGERSAITWTHASSSYSPGRLDWVLYDHDAWREVHAFTLDTRTMTPRARLRAGLRAGDSAASDHLPLVVDLEGR